MTPSEALKPTLTLVEASAALKDDTQRMVLLRGIVVVAQKSSGVAPDGVTECAPNVTDVSCAALGSLCLWRCRSSFGSAVAGSGLTLSLADAVPNVPPLCPTREERWSIPQIG